MTRAANPASRSRRGAILAAVLSLTFALQPLSARADDLLVDGHVAHPLDLPMAELMKLPVTAVDVSFQTGQGQENGHYAGVLLWTLLQRAALADAEGKRPDLRHTLTVIGRDGYTVALAFGEIDPDFEGKTVILAYQRDGHPLDSKDPLRLIVPGDKHGGRAVRDVVRITVN